MSSCCASTATGTPDGANDWISSKRSSASAFLAPKRGREIETWALAGLRLPSDWNWAAVRAEVQVKERYFDVLSRLRGVDGGPDNGRSELGDEAARHIDAIRQKCPDDFDALARRLEAIIHGN